MGGRGWVAGEIKNKAISAELGNNLPQSRNFHYSQKFLQTMSARVEGDKHSHMSGLQFCNH